MKIHGEMEGNHEMVKKEMRENGEGERKVRENEMKREKKLSKMKLVRV